MLEMIGGEGLLEFKDVYYEVCEKVILKNVNLSVLQGEFLSVLGSSGGGKTTFIRLCSNLISPTRGNIYFKGEDLNELDPILFRQQTGYCFQEPHLFGDTVKENLCFPYMVRGEKFDIDRVYGLFNLFEIDKGFLDRKVDNLSGGEKQRIALVRTVLFTPKLMLLDEVTSALDSENAMLVEKVMNKLNKEGMTIIWITHDKEQASRISGNKIFINNGSLKRGEDIDGK